MDADLPSAVKKLVPNVLSIKLSCRRLETEKFAACFLKMIRSNFREVTLLLSKSRKMCLAFLKSRITAFGFRFAAVFCVRGGLGKADGKGVRRGAAGGVQQAEILVAVL